jgi:MarR family transcriptional regulator for hemolysin
VTPVAEKKRLVIAKANNRKRSITLKLWVVARHLRQSFHETVERRGVTRSKWTLIAAVARQPGATQRMLAEALEVREISVGRLVNRLCAEGYLKRRKHPNDGRAYCVYLAPAARPVLDTLDELAKVHEAAIFAGFNDEDLETLDALLDAIARNLTAAQTADDAKK